MKRRDREEAEKKDVVKVVWLVLGQREAVELRHRVREEEDERVGDKEILALLESLTWTGRGMQ